MPDMIDGWDAEKLREFIRWCEDVGVVPMANGWPDGEAWDQGCGCCSDMVNVPPRFRAGAA